VDNGSIIVDVVVSDDVNVDVDVIDVVVDVSDDELVLCLP